jgi:hypothetical protein
MRYGNAKPNSGAHGLLAVTQRGKCLITMSRIETLIPHKAIDDLLNGLPPVGGRHLGNDLILREQARQRHVMGFPVRGK